MKNYRVFPYREKKGNSGAGLEETTCEDPCLGKAQLGP